MTETDLLQIAVVATTPWDSYLIRNRVWTYPPEVILGPTLVQIPLEEIFFFVVQTYNTALLYIILTKPTFHPVFLRGGKDGAARTTWRFLGQFGLVACVAWGALQVWQGGRGLYMGLIMVWACPFMLLLW